MPPGSEVERSGLRVPIPVRPPRRECSGESETKFIMLALRSVFVRRFPLATGVELELVFDLIPLDGIPHSQKPQGDLEKVGRSDAVERGAVFTNAVLGAALR